MRSGDRLDSWKEISLYIDRDVGTCTKWAKNLGLPVYKIDKGSRRSTVFAFRSEIDRWFRERAK